MMNSCQNVLLLLCRVDTINIILAHAGVLVLSPLPSHPPPRRHPAPTASSSSFLQLPTFSCFPSSFCCCTVVGVRCKVPPPSVEDGSTQPVDSKSDDPHARPVLYDAFFGLHHGSINRHCVIGRAAAAADLLSVCVGVCCTGAPRSAAGTRTQPAQCKSDSRQDLLAWKRVSRLAV